MGKSTETSGMSATKMYAIPITPDVDERALCELLRAHSVRYTVIERGSNTPHQQRTRDKGAAPHWLRCDITKPITPDGYGPRCVLGSGHGGPHEYPKVAG